MLQSRTQLEAQTHEENLRDRIKSLIIPIHTLRGMCSDDGEPHHMRLLRESAQFNRSQRNVSSRSYSDPTMGSEFQYSTRRGSIVAREDEEEEGMALPPPSVPPPPVEGMLLLPPPTPPGASGSAHPGSAHPPPPSPFSFSSSSSSPSSPFSSSSPSGPPPLSPSMKRAQILARRNVHRRAHSALDVQSMPLSGIMRFLFRLYTTTTTVDDSDHQHHQQQQQQRRYTITIDNILRLLRDSNLYGKDYQWSRLLSTIESTTTISSSSSALNWLEFMMTLQSVADDKYPDDDQGLDKLQRRYLRPLAVSISRNKRVEAATKEYVKIIFSLNFIFSSSY